MIQISKRARANVPRRRGDEPTPNGPAHQVCNTLLLSYLHSKL